MLLLWQETVISENMEDMSCFVLSCPVLSCPVLSCPALDVLSYAVSSGLLLQETVISEKEEDRGVFLCGPEWKVPHPLPACPLYLDWL